MARPPRLRRLTFSLLKEGLSHGDALVDRDDILGFVVPSLHAERDSLFVAARDPHPPWWMAFLDLHVDGELANLWTASSSAVLLLEAAGRLFAVTFGQGRYLLAPDAVEVDFGLKVTLNAVRPDRLKSVDARTIDETTLHTRRDVSRDSTFAAFDLDVTRDLVRSVTGTPLDETLARRLTGADSVALNTRAQVPDLPALCEQLLEVYGSDAYKESFEFIDYLRPEKRRGLLQELQQELLDALNEGDLEDVHLACPEPMDWLDVAGFRYERDLEVELDPDPRITAYLELHQGDDIDLDALKRDRLYAISDSDGSSLREWPIYRCLVYETELRDELYVLSAGEWFRVSLSFKDRVYAYVDDLSETLLALPEPDPGTDEDGYNRKAAEALGGLLLDKQLVFQSPDKMEICDVLTHDPTLLHVKQRGSSSTLSHLFAQGVNCAERLLEDPEFRTEARAVVARIDTAFADALPDRQPEPGSYEIGFVVLTRSDRDTPLTLPFFSLVSLRSAAMRLRGLGYKVTATSVREPPG